MTSALAIAMLKTLALLTPPILLLWPTAAAADDFYCYLETDEGQIFNLGEVCGGGDSFSTSNSFFNVPGVPTTDAEAAFLAEYTVEFLASDPDLAEFVPTDAELQEAFRYRDGFEEVLDNAYRLCRGQTPVWLYPEFAELVFPGNTWTEFVQGLDTFSRLCNAAA